MCSYQSCRMSNSKMAKRLLFSRARYWILLMVNEMKSTAQTIKKKGRKRAILWRLTKEFDITVKANMSTAKTCNEAVSKLIVKETRLEESEKSVEKTLLTHKGDPRKHCYTCVTLGYFSKNSSHNKKCIREKYPWEYILLHIPQTGKYCLKCINRKRSEDIFWSIAGKSQRQELGQVDIKLWVHEAYVKP